ncbi:MAG TPA: 3'-5' exonuclease [Ottowia sp.]|uniref:3'-5' exonuclease n=1 Tax=Ottowia sp. TaxID=1898956 RepID=UPI002B8B52D4|nr:3'-5' exonuclease [Ottowia sp.]HMN22186.1 3'-5' exonuclease [Ottowia sp.]
MDPIGLVKRGWQQRQLKDPAWQFLFDAPPADQWVALACTCTGHDVQRDDIVAIAAVPIHGARVLASARLELVVQPGHELPAETLRALGLRQQDLAAGTPPKEAVQRLLRFVGARPLVGYYLEFAVAMLDRIARPLLGIGLPQPKIDVSALYYEHRFRQLPLHQQTDQAAIDLRFASMMEQLRLPTRAPPDALNQAVMAALAFVKLQALHAGG